MQAAIIIQHGQNELLNRDGRECRLIEKMMILSKIVLGDVSQRLVSSAVQIHMQFSISLLDVGSNNTLVYQHEIHKFLQAWSEDDLMLESVSCSESKKASLVIKLFRSLMGNFPCLQ